LKICRANSVFRASASCSKTLNDKKIFQYSEKFNDNSVFQGKRKLLKNPECKKYIFSTVNSRHPLFFRANAKLLKNPKRKKYIQDIEKIQGNSVFSGQALVAQKSRTVKNFQYSLYIHLGGDP